MLLTLSAIKGNASGEDGPDIAKDVMLTIKESAKTIAGVSFILDIYCPSKILYFYIMLFSW
jgi:hypothetical protein